MKTKDKKRNDQLMMKLRIERSTINRPLASTLDVVPVVVFGFKLGESEEVGIADEPVDPMFAVLDVESSVVPVIIPDVLLIGVGGMVDTIDQPGIVPNVSLIVQVITDGLDVTDEVDVIALVVSGVELLVVEEVDATEESVVVPLAIPCVDAKISYVFSISFTKGTQLYILEVTGPAADED